MLTYSNSFVYTHLAKSLKNNSQGSTKAGHLTGKMLKSHWARGCIGNIDDVTLSTTNTAFLAEASTARRQLLRERLTHQKDTTIRSSRQTSPGHKQVAITHTLHHHISAGIPNTAFGCPSVHPSKTAACHQTG
jgi:hypothetical protein